MFAFAALPALACDVAASTSTVVPDSYSPASLQGGAVPYLRTASGFGCTADSVVVLLGGNYLKATVASGAVLKLTSTDTSGTIGIKIAADSGGSTPLNPGTTVTFMQNTTLNVAGLLSSDIQSVPVFVKPSTTDLVAPGTYTGSVSIKWEWGFCPGVNVGSVCVLGADTGSKSGTVQITLTIAPRTAVMTITSVTTWDPIRKTNSPKAIPGGKVRRALTVTNPDLVPLDADSLKVVLPTPATLAVALDGDGSGAGDVVQLSQGATPSGLSLTYAGPASIADDVEFFCADGTGWGCAPTAGDATTQGAVTQVRLKPRGSMAAGSSFTVSLPYSVK